MHVLSFYVRRQCVDKLKSQMQIFDANGSFVDQNQNMIKGPEDQNTIHLICSISGSFFLLNLKHILGLGCVPVLFWEIKHTQTIKLNLQKVENAMKVG